MDREDVRFYEDATYGPCTPHSRGKRLMMLDEAITRAIVAIVNNHLD